MSATKTGGPVRSVMEGSPAARAGIQGGDFILGVGEYEVRDIIDWQWLTDGVEVLAFVERDGVVHQAPMTRSPDEPWGIEFGAALFDGVRTCRNNCTFCFMRQLPKGMRKALYVRDDDFRLSFLDGNFITLTNLTDDDIDRIEEQRLSPLNVSVHAVDADVRAKLVCAKEDRALERLDRLLEIGVDVHVQIVLVPGVNDGDVLDRTLTWLAEREGIDSVGIVPVGYTRHQDAITESYTDQIAAATVIQQVQRWQFESRARDDRTWVHLADEFYLNARAPFPTTEWYDDFPQYENGIGMVRMFVDEALELKHELVAAVKRLPQEGESVTIVTGMMAATTLAGALNACEAAGYARLLAVPNRFFGGNVSVTGLLTGADITDAIAADFERFGRPTAYLVPDVVLNAEGMTLDDMEFSAIRAKSGADVRLVSSDAPGLLAGINEVADNPAS